MVTRVNHAKAQGKRGVLTGRGKNDKIITLILTKGVFTMNDDKKLVRFLLTFFLGWIGSLVINHTDIKPEGYTSRTAAYFVLGIVTFGIYPLVASICQFSFDPKKDKNIGYEKDPVVE